MMCYHSITVTTLYVTTQRLLQLCILQLGDCHYFVCYHSGTVTTL